MPTPTRKYLTQFIGLFKNAKNFVERIIGKTPDINGEGVIRIILTNHLPICK